MCAWESKKSQRVNVVLLSPQEKTPTRCLLYLTCSIALVILIIYSGKVDIIIPFIDLIPKHNFRSNTKAQASGMFNDVKLVKEKLNVKTLITGAFWYCQGDIKEFWVRVLKWWSHNLQFMHVVSAVFRRCGSRLCFSAKFDKSILILLKILTAAHCF